MRLISVKENYGGMSEGALLSLCEVLDRDRSNLVKLAQGIFDEHRIRFDVREGLPLGIYDAMDLIAFHFKMCSTRRLSKGEAVDTLNERLKSINQETSEILDKDALRQLSKY